MKKILITGSGGFIFSNFVRKAIKDKEQFDFASIDKVKKTSVFNNLLANQDHRFYIGDVADKHFMNVVFEFERPDYVIHGAAETDPTGDILESNVLGTQVIIDVCKRWGVSKLIYISDYSVYGALENDSEPTWSETVPIAPRNIYGASKAAGEMLIISANIINGLKYNIIRLCNNYGPRQSANELIPGIIKSAIDGVNFLMPGQGAEIRDWTHVQDTCSAILTVLKNGKDNEIYNVSSGQEYSNIEVFQSVCNELERGHNLIQFVQDDRPIDKRLAMSSSKLKEIGWKPSFKFKAGIEHTVNFYTNNMWWFRQKGIDV
jgi:dTDP-glucose 4,6-dehydratase